MWEEAKIVLNTHVKNVDSTYMRGFYKGYAKRLKGFFTPIFWNFTRDAQALLNIIMYKLKKLKLVDLNLFSPHSPWLDQIENFRILQCK